MNKPIDYAKLKVGDAVVHVDGRKGKVVSINPDSHPDFRFTVFWDTGRVVSYTETGAIHMTARDCVFLAPSKVKHRQYINLYANGNTGLAVGTEELAKQTARAGCVETRCIEWEVEE